MLNINKFVPMTGVEPRTSGIGSDRSTNWATQPLPDSKFKSLPMTGFELRTHDTTTAQFAHHVTGQQMYTSLKEYISAKEICLRWRENVLLCNFKID